MRNGEPGKLDKTLAKAPSLSGTTTVELFAGIGGFRIAAERRGIHTTWANDLCPRACTVYRQRFGAKEIREGDIRIVADSIPPHEVLTGGFPCQPFSSAGKKHGIRDPRGTLFQRIVDILAERQPTYFILENVKRLLTMERGFHFATIVSSLAELNYHIEWRLLNAMHFGLPQNRQRVFIVGIHGRALSPTNSLAAAPIRIRLATGEDIADHGGCLLHDAWDISAWNAIERHGCRFPSWGLARSGKFVSADLGLFSSASPLLRVRDVLQDEVGAEFDFTDITSKWIHANTPVNKFVQGVEILSNQGGGARMGYTIFGINGLAPTLTSTTSRHYERYKIGDRYRRLTNTEYARIQGFPDDHCAAVPIYDQYALFGNAVPPPLAGWVMDRLGGAGIGPADVPDNLKEMNLFTYARKRAAEEGFTTDVG